MNPRPEPTECPECLGITVYNHACGACGWRRRCSCGCGFPIDGQAEKRYYSATCRSRARRQRREPIADRLAALTEDDRRDVIRRAYEIASPEGGRLKLRFGPYHPGL
jgi:hypothetical protein